jgi:putative endonuclease
MFSFLKHLRKMAPSDPDLPGDRQHLTIGRTGEELARRYLERQGYRILACNYRVSLGEIDIIAEEKDVLAFVEVKTRTSTSHGHPLEAVTAAKQRQLARVALHFLSNQREERAVRFDVIAILLEPDRQPQIELARNAFDLPSGM